MARTTAASGALAVRKAGLLAGGGVLLSLVFGLLTGLPAQAHAETVGAFEIVATDPGQPLDGGDYSYSGNVLEIKTDKPVTVSMANPDATTNTDRIVVSSLAADITLAGVKIKLSVDDDCAFEIKSNASAKLTLAEGSANSLVSGTYRAGLKVPAGASVSIGGEGSLEAKCFSEVRAYGAGIGGDQGGSAGSIEITGGTVTASCESSGTAHGAGIGDGSYGSGARVAISGGRIKAAGSVEIDSAATITGGLFADGVLGDGTVYKVKPSEGCVVRESPFEDKDAYPYAVAAPAGDFMVTGGAQGVDYSYGSNVLELRTGTPMVVSMKEGVSKTQDSRILVSANTTRTSRSRASRST